MPTRWTHRDWKVIGQLVAGVVVVGLAITAFAGDVTHAGREPFGLDARQRHVADQILSVFENSTTTIRYDYIEDIGDGRGYTAGRAGFCTACGDLLDVVRQYTAADPDNPLAGYLPALRRLAADWSDSHDGLDGIEDAWREAAADPAFRQAQDTVNDRLYYDPAMELARQQGVRSPLGLVVVYDTAVQHGLGDGPDTLDSIIERTVGSAGGGPADGVDERSWLAEFLAVRRETLENPGSDDTAEVWGQSVGRVDALRQLLDEGNLELRTPLTIEPFGTSFDIS